MGSDNAQSLSAVGDSGFGRRHNDEEALIEKDMIENRIPTPHSQTSIIRASFWIAVNTLATIGIVGHVYFYFYFYIFDRTERKCV